MNKEKEVMQDIVKGADRFQAASPPPADGVILTCGKDLKMEPITWLWKDWLAVGKLHILAGAPGQGKTTIALSMSATVTQGGRWADGSRAPKGNVLIWSGEDDAADTLLPRLLAAGADRERCFFVNGARENGQLIAFDPSKHMAQLLSAVEEIGGVRLIVVDPVVSAVSGDSHQNAEVRRALQPLVDLAAASRAAVVGITHFAKGGQGQDPMLRVVGSVAFSAVARVVLVAAKVDGEEGGDKRVIARAKSNIGPDAGGFRYQIEHGEAEPGIPASFVSWGEAVEGTARELLAQPEEDAEAAPRHAAAEFLQEVLAEGPTPVKTIQEEAKAAGHAWSTVRRAAGTLALVKKKGGMESGWYWSLAKMPTKEPKKPTSESWAPSAPSDVSEHLRGGEHAA